MSVDFHFPEAPAYFHVVSVVDLSVFCAIFLQLLHVPINVNELKTK